MKLVLRRLLVGFRMARPSTPAAASGSCLKAKPVSALRAAANRRNARAMHEISPLCPNCVQPMRLTRRIAADEAYQGQDVFECSVCRVAMTQTSRGEGRKPR